MAQQRKLKTPKFCRKGRIYNKLHHYRGSFSKKILVSKELKELFKWLEVLQVDKACLMYMQKAFFSSKT